MKRAVSVLVLSLALGVGGLYLAVGSELFQLETYRLRNPSAFYLAAFVVALFAEWMSPGLKVSLLCRGQGLRISYWPALKVHLVGVLGAAVTPSNSGGVPATVAALGRLGVPVGKGIGVVVQIFILDLIFFSWSAPLGLGFLIYSGAIQLPIRAEFLTVVAVTLAAVGAFVMSRHPKIVVRLLLALAKWPLLRRFENRITNTANDYQLSARAYLKLPVRTWISLHAVTAVGWMAGFVILWSLLGLYGVQAGFLTILSLLASIVLISHFVPTPGGAGFIEATVALAVGAGVGSVAAAVLLWRILSFYLIFLIGPVAGWFLYLSNPIRDPNPQSARRPVQEPVKAPPRAPEKRP